LELLLLNLLKKITSQTVWFC